MNNFLPRATPKEVQKNPMGYILLVMAALLGWFGSLMVNSDKSKTTALENSVKDCRLDAETYRKTISIQQIRIDYLTDIFINRDSANRVILDVPLKRLINHDKK